MTHQAEGLCPCTAHAESKKYSYLLCRHTNTNSVHDKMTIYFALDNNSKK
jgi:hypothetical protein